MKRKIIKQLVFGLILIAIWEILILLKIWPEYIFPSPSKVMGTLIEGFRNTSFLVAIGISLRRLIIGYGISILCGGILGLLICKFRVLDETIGSFVLGLQTLPSICWFPLALLWFGLNERAIIFVVVAGALFSITIAVEGGIKNVPRQYINAGMNMGARRVRLFREIMLPAAMPSIISGLKQGWSFAWRSLMAGELLFGNLGLGYLLLMGRELNDMSQIIAVMITIAFISILVDKLIFGRIELNIMQRWGIAKQR